jgi:phosphate transport system substrate-binding protein
VDPPASAKDAYPISGLTFLIVRKDGKDSVKRETVKNFINYIVGPGQGQSESLSYAALPPMLQAQDQKLLDEMMANGQPIPGTTTSASR